jgi:hypothetical protein
LSSRRYSRRASGDGSEKVEVDVQVLDVAGLDAVEQERAEGRLGQLARPAAGGEPVAVEQVEGLADVPLLGVVPEGVLRADGDAGEPVERGGDPVVVALAGAGAHGAQQLGDGEADGAVAELVVAQQLHQGDVHLVVGGGGQAEGVAAGDQPLLAHGPPGGVAPLLDDGDGLLPGVARRASTAKGNSARFISSLPGVSSGPNSDARRPRRAPAPSVPPPPRPPVAPRRPRRPRAAATGPARR